MISVNPKHVFYGYVKKVENMVIHGKDLIILANGTPLAASKSCTIDIDVEAIKVSDATDGQWEHNIAGRKSWDVTTNHLVLSSHLVDDTIVAKAFAHDGISIPFNSFVSTKGGTVSFGGRGLNVVRFRTHAPYIPNANVVNYDTYGDDATGAEEEAERLDDWLNNTYADLDDHYPIAIVSYDAFGMFGFLRNTIESTLSVDMSVVPLERSRGALVVIGCYDWDAGMMCYVPPIDVSGSSAQTKMHLYGGVPATDHAVKDMLQKAGQQFDLRWQTEGMVFDTMHGKALCKQAKITATKGNLIAGSFKWVGNGKLE